MTAPQAIQLNFHFTAKPGQLQIIKKGTGDSPGTETEEIYRHSLAIMVGNKKSQKTHTEGLIQDYYNKPLSAKGLLLQEVPEDPMGYFQPTSDEEKMAWLSRIWNAHSGEVATLIPTERETPWTWSSYEDLQREFRDLFVDARKMKEFPSMAAWLATKKPFNDEKFKFEQGPRFLMRPTPAQLADRHSPNLYDLPCRILAPDARAPFAGVWRPFGFKLVDMALLWQYMGDYFTAKQIFDFYKALPLYAIKRIRTSRKHKSELEEKSLATLKLTTLEAAKTICKRFGIDPENLPQGNDIKVFAEHRKQWASADPQEKVVDV